MVRYSAGNKKKRLILEVCRKLFYQKGYENTTYADICELADIPQGSISYHFTGKQQIASIVRYELERETNTYINMLCDGLYPDKILPAIEIFHFWQRFFDDANLRRFIVEAPPLPVPDDLTWFAVSRLFEKAIEKFGVIIDDNEFEFMVCSQVGLSEKLFSLVNMDISNYSAFDLARFEIKFFYGLLGVPNTEIGAIIEKAWLAFRGLDIDPNHYVDFQYTDYFDELTGKLL